VFEFHDSSLMSLVCIELNAANFTLDAIILKIIIKIFFVSRKSPIRGLIAMRYMILFEVF